MHGRLEQVAFYLVAFATAGIILATLNWHNSRLGFWSNAVTVSIGDIPFILFVLIPGYAPVWPGVLGPVLWIAAFGLHCNRSAADHQHARRDRCGETLTVKMLTTRARCAPLACFAQGRR